MSRADAPAAPRFSLSRQIGIAVLAGLAVGLVIGERARIFDVFADAFIKLLQMSVLPYVTVSIIGGLGALNAAQARTLVSKVGLVLLLVWTVALSAVFLFPLMFPPSVSASFFSETLLDDREAFDFLELYIPANPFHSLANNIVPAVVLFSLMIGTGLIAVPDKGRLLDVLSILGKAITRATNFVVNLTPYGVFAISAVAAGTLGLEDLVRLRVYLISYVGIAMLVSLWVLPGLVAALTPVPFRVLLSTAKDALVMAFMTTSLIAVLPLLTEQAKELCRKYGGERAGSGVETDVIVPASFNFPHTGKLLSLSFLLFAGWFADTPVPVQEYPRVAGTGLLAMFGNVNAAIPFMLDLLRIPADTFRLFIASGVVNARFGTLVAAVHTLTVAVLTSCALAGTLRVDSRRLTRFVAITVVLTTAVVGGTRMLLRLAPEMYTKDRLLAAMEPLRDRGPAHVFGSGEAPPPLLEVKTTVLDRVRESGRLRVAYFPDSLPYAFRNGRGALVGFDVEMAMQLARDLGVGIEFVEIPRSALDDGLTPATCDLVMSGAVVTTTRAELVLFSQSYLDETIAFVVRDHLTAKFSDWSTIRALGPLRIGMPTLPYYEQKVRDELKNATVVPFTDVDGMFKPDADAVDALVLTAERGSAYTLLHPQYSVAVPKPRPFRVPLAYVVAGRDEALASTVNTWIDLKRKDGTIDELFAHWILGRDTTEKAPRWSVIDNVIRRPK